MTLLPSSTQIYCQTCANAWDLTDTNGEYYFRSASLPIGGYTSPADIVALTEEMTFCPKCDVEQLAASYRKPAPGIQESPFYDHDSRMVGANIDAGDPGDGDATAVHRVFRGPVSPSAPVGPVTEIVLDVAGLVFRDQFNRIDAQALGNGWIDWEGAATQVQLVSNKVLCAAIASKTGAARPIAEIGGTVDLMVHSNFNVSSNNLGGVRSRWNGVTNSLGYTFRGDTRGGGQWNIIKNNVSVLATGVSGPPLNNQWYGIRGVIEGTALRLLSTPALVDNDDLSADLVQRCSAVDGSIITSVNQTGLEKDQLATSVQFDEYFVCGRLITITGVPTGWKIQVDARTAVVESGGSVSFNVETWALPATDIKVLDDLDVEQDLLTPLLGVWGGDQYSVTSV